MQNRRNHQAHRVVNLVDLVAGALLLTAIAIGIAQMLGADCVWYWGVIAALLAIAIWVRSGIGAPSPAGPEPNGIDDLIDEFQGRK